MLRKGLDLTNQQDVPDSAVNVFPVPGGPHKSMTRPLPVTSVSYIRVWVNRSERTLSVDKVIEMLQLPVLCRANESYQQSLLCFIDDEVIQSLSVPFNFGETVDLGITYHKFLASLGFRGLSL